MNLPGLSEQYCHFFDDEQFEPTEREGFRRRVITGDAMQLCFWRIAGGATGSRLHNHEEHEQLGVIVRGGLDFRIGGADPQERVTLGEGDVYLAPVGVWHGDSVFLGDSTYGECWILDVFVPPRDDLRAAGEPDER
ncbi:MAG: cupin domain-containing protein [Acidimicrobiia bacterium]|jgi:quercetin dioxygenase-like cupin family protein|nr:cupin domain-containing protein [Acidimicrobiia bacterium]MBA3983959.1 cupin domain-containing protein [Acidimicrobiia bacterium]MDQ3392484.1 cupin domain-containing protein [Actinomycetota bacterium]